jgi:hypothetical protein
LFLLLTAVLKIIRPGFYLFYYFLGEMLGALELNPLLPFSWKINKRRGRGMSSVSLKFNFKPIKARPAPSAAHSVKGVFYQPDYYVIVLH